MPIIFKNERMCQVFFKGNPEEVAQIVYKGNTVFIKEQVIRIETSGPFVLPAGVTQVRFRIKGNGGGGGGGHGGQTADVFDDTRDGHGGFGGQQGGIKEILDPIDVLNGETLDIQFGNPAPGGAGGPGGVGGGTRCRDHGTDGAVGSNGATIIIKNAAGTTIASQTGADGGAAQTLQEGPTQGDTGLGTGGGAGGATNGNGFAATGNEGAGGGGGGGGLRGEPSCNGGFDAGDGGAGALGWVEIIIGGDCV